MRAARTTRPGMSSGLTGTLASRRGASRKATAAAAAIAIGTAR